MQKPRTASRNVDDLARRIGDMHTLPTIALKVIELTRNPETPISKLEELIEGDPALATKILKTVNSSAFGLREKITTLRQAISYLGSHAVRNLGMALSVSRVFKQDSQVGPYRRSELWRHMVSVALGARLVAKHCRQPNFEDAYLAGLLHDIGFILADQHDHEAFRNLVGSLQAGDALIPQEKRHLGYTHTQLGCKVAESWKLPKFIVDAIRVHHASHICREPHAPIVQAVEVANALCNEQDITALGLRLAGEPAAGVLENLGLAPENLASLLIELGEEIKRNSALFRLL